MKSTPLLYTAPMVRAVLDGSKTQTRRVVKPQPANDWGFESPPVLGRITSQHHLRGRFGVFIRRGLGTDFPEADLIPCPYGQPGDQLWGRETFYAYGCWETRFNAKKSRDEWHFVDMTLECGFTYSYAATDSNPLPMRGKRNAGVTPGWWMRPAIFMPRAASRLTLEIVSVRVERLSGISEADAKTEGCDRLVWDGSIVGADANLIDWPLKEVANPYRNGYAMLWQSINGPGSWNLNPFVWAIEFKRATP